MGSIRILFAALLVSALPTLLGGIANAQSLRIDGGSCMPGLPRAFKAHSAAYSAVYNALLPNVSSLTTQLMQVVDQSTYQLLLTSARTIASQIPNGRVLITLPDGSVVIDTARPDDPTNIMPQGNSFQHFTAKTVNENHNSRVSIFSAQQYPCGVGIESKLSTTTGNTESYVAIRLGDHLDSEGTVRGSTF